jgi:hypothetical protein
VVLVVQLVQASPAVGVALAGDGAQGGVTRWLVAAAAADVVWVVRAWTAWWRAPPAAASLSATACGSDGGPTTAGTVEPHSGAIIQDGWWHGDHDLFEEVLPNLAAYGSNADTTRRGRGPPFVELPLGAEVYDALRGAGLVWFWPWAGC